MYKLDKELMQLCQQMGVIICKFFSTNWDIYVHYN